MTAAYPTDTQVPPRSSFVTVVAWIFIVLSGFATLVGALQNLMIRFMPFDQVDSVLQDSTTATQFPPAARFMFSHFRRHFPSLARNVGGIVGTSTSSRLGAGHLQRDASARHSLHDRRFVHPTIPYLVI